ncbi:hypothetical protein D3C75_1042670 [compost metagenome]
MLHQTLHQCTITDDYINWLCTAHNCSDILQIIWVNLWIGAVKTKLIHIDGWNNLKFDFRMLQFIHICKLLTKRRIVLSRPEAANT